MSRSNAGFAFDCFWPSAPATVILTFLGFARLESRSAALDTRTTTVGCTAEALDFSTGSRQYIFQVIFRIKIQIYFELSYIIINYLLWPFDKYGLHNRLIAVKPQDRLAKIFIDKSKLTAVTLEIFYVLSLLPCMYNFLSKD
jgi:hypothetical protein